MEKAQALAHFLAVATAVKVGVATAVEVGVATAVEVGVATAVVGQCILVHFSEKFFLLFS